MSALQLPIPAAGPRLVRPRLRPVTGVAASGGRARPAPEPAGTPDTADGSARRLAPTSRAQAVRRQVVVALALLALALLGLASAADGPAAGVGASPVAAATVVVEPGETVWEIAVRTAPPGTSPADWAASIIDVNRLDGGSVASWQVLRLPAP